MCHTTAFGPNLTPFGREFKLNGYVQEGGGKTGYIPPLSGMVQGSFTNTQKDQNPPPGPSGFNPNNNFTFDQASLFYAGKIYGKLGAFSQLTYDGVADTVFLDNTDVRMSDQADVGEWDVVYGVTANNSPTVQDLWNTTPAWGFPFSASPIAPTPSAAPLLEGGVNGVSGGQMGGASLYAMVNRLVYLEAGAYGSFSRSFLKGTGNYSWDQPLDRIDGGAPYWRIALQKQWEGHYFELGHYGMIANVYPYGDRTQGTNNYTDLAMDATYQYLGNMENIFEVRTSYLRENRDLKANVLRGDILNRANYVDVFKINATYTYLQTYSLAFGYNKIWTRNDTVLDPETGLMMGGGNNGSQYFTAELSYVPFGKDYSLLSSLMNLRLALQYVGYNQFDGSQSQAANNNTFLINGWLAF